MKKPLLSLLIGIWCFVAVTESLAVERHTLGDGVTRYWNNPNSWLPSGVPQNGDIIVIDEGDVIEITQVTTLNSVVVQVYGQVRFVEWFFDYGELILDENSTVQVSSTGSFDSWPGTVYDRNQITIGDNSLNGNDIEGLNNSRPNEYTENSLGSGGCASDASCTFVPLPVELISFEARTKFSSIEISWSTAKEWNFSHYILQHSTDGVNFTDLQRVDSELESSMVKEYSITDNLPVAGLNYYRLLAIDADGKQEDHGIVAASIEAVSGFTVYPNPNTAHQNFNILVSSKENGQALLQDASGKLLYASPVKGGKASLSGNSIKSGIYFITVITADETFKQKVIVP
jgi:hypothetical protein